MKILHVIPRIAPQQGGLRSGTIAICRAMQAVGMTPEIACLEEPDDAEPEGIPIHRFKPGLKMLGASIEMRNWLLDHAPEYDAIVAHVVWLNPAHYATQAAARAGIPLLLGSRGMLDPDALRHHRLRKVVRWHLGVRKLVRGSLLVFTTPEDRDRSLSHSGLEGMNSVVIPNPVEPIEPGPETRPPIVLCLNRLHPRKGVREFVECARILKDRGLDLSAVHAGNCEVADYADEVCRLGAGVVDFRGRLPRDEVRALLRQCAIVVHPATGYENFGNVIAEGMSAGKAVVGSPRALATPQLDRAGVVKMVEPEPEKMAQVITELLSDEPARNDLGARAREYALTEFSLKRIGELWREAISNARHSVSDEMV